ncbi:hypothetical protein [Salipaludibacillus agaradhaerens]|uniref:hypothetical protein n=1 Tax=Salipaludibacillus agaradhaerens TaxID=76935 RepID=UPI000998A2A2|nr:hypothetical protein [Salipaludibacillus agaradhaerens]
MGQMTTSYQFMRYIDSLDKAGVFNQSLERIAERHEELKKFVEKELQHSHGEMVTEVLDDIKTTSKNYHDTAALFQQVMDQAETAYIKHLNAMRFQKITVYYDEIETGVGS